MAYGIPLGGQRVIVAERASKGTGREIVIPGLRDHPDIEATGLWDKEFRRGVIPRGYTEVNSPTWDLGTTVKGHLVMQANANVSRRGIFWPSPPAPFTVTMKLASLIVFPTTTDNSQQFGLCVSKAAPDFTDFNYMQFATLGDGTTNVILQGRTNASATNSVSTPGYGICRPVYFRLVVGASTTACQFSFDGKLYTQLASASTGFTPGSFGMQIFNGTTVALAPTKYAVPFFKVTTP